MYNGEADKYLSGKRILIGSGCDDKSLQLWAEP